MSTDGPNIDILDTMANEPAPAESQGSEREDLPDKAWLLGRVVTEGGAAPEVRAREFTVKDENKKVVLDDEGEPKKRTVRQLHIAFETLGGDSKMEEAKHRRAFLFNDFWIHAQDGSISPRFIGFLNTIFARGVADGEKDRAKRKDARWKETMKVLKKAREDNPEIEDSAYDNDPGRVVAALAVAAMKDQDCYALAKTQHRKYTTRSGEDRVSVEIAAVEDAVRERIDKRKVQVYGGVALSIDLDEMTEI